MDNNVFELILLQNKQNELSTLISCNEKIEQFGLTLTEDDAEELMVCRNESLRKHKRVEFYNGILDKLIFTFCDSQFISQDNYVELLEELQDIFYEFKNESEDKLTDEELLTFMREQFESVCFGDLEYLSGTCLERFCTAIRAGYEGYKETGGSHEYEQFSEEARWDKNLYLQVLRELCWG